jgi:CHAT domain-containing protein
MLILDFLAPLLQLFLKNANLSTLLPPRDPPAPAEPHLKVSWSAAPEGSVLIHPPALATTKMLSSLLQSRRNWIDDPDALSRIMELCGQIVRNLGLRVDDIDAITRADMVQISFPVPTVDGQDFPWEFVLAEATRQRGLRTSRLPEQTLLVVRHMPPPVIGGPKARKRRSAPPDTASFSAPEKLLFVKSAPGRLADLYEFESEQRLISSSLNLLSQPIVLSDPNATEISQRVASDQPDIIHLSGVDSVQGAKLLRVPRATSPGMYLLANGQAEVLSYTKLAEILTPPSTKRPRLVTFNMYNSSAGAAMAVARGAGAAIGFQDDIDDALAEQFLANLYSEWKHVNWDLIMAYRAALLTVVPQQIARGSGIVLWTATSVLDPFPSRGTSSTRSSEQEEIIPADLIIDASTSLRG